MTAKTFRPGIYSARAIDRLTPVAESCSGVIRRRIETGARKAANLWLRNEPRTPTGIISANDLARRTTTKGASCSECSTQSGHRSSGELTFIRCHLKLLFASRLCWRNRGRGVANRSISEVGSGNGGNNSDPRYTRSLDPEICNKSWASQDMRFLDYSSRLDD
jgi:hypothetical protein